MSVLDRCGCFGRLLQQAAGGPGAIMSPPSCSVTSCCGRYAVSEHAGSQRAGLRLLCITESNLREVTTVSNRWHNNADYRDGSEVSRVNQVDGWRQSG